MPKNLFAVATGLGLLLSFAIADAQTAPSNVGTTGASENSSALSEVVVTGSRLETKILDSPAPIQTLDTLQLEQTGTDSLERTLTQLPSIGVGLSDTNSENYYALAGLNLIDLRHLGYNRTLVLVNGRRQVPGDIYTTAVDLNSIPTPLVERVEVVTGGTSAVYGADAVSGVVNIILKDHYEGLDVRLRGALTAYGDGAQEGVSILGGSNFADNRGNVTASLLFDNTKGVPATARHYALAGTGYYLNPNGGTPNNGPPLYLTLNNVRYAGINQLGLIGPVGGQFYTPINGGTAVRPYDTGTLGLDANFTQVLGDGGFFQPFDNLSQPLKRYNGAFNTTFKIAGDAELFGEARLAYNESSTRWQPPADFEYGSFPISASNPYVPANLQPLLAAAGQNNFYFGREYEDLGRRGGDSHRFTQQYTGGIRGPLGDKLKYEAFVGYGQTDLGTLLVNGRDQARFLQSVDVVTLNGAPACADPAARAEGCQPFNPFDPASTPGGIAYSKVTDHYSARQTLWMTGASVSGEIYSLPAGAVSAAAGVEARSNTAQTFPSALAQAGGVQLFFEQPERGTIDVKEAFGELRVPVLAKLPLINDLTLQGAARYSDYNVNGAHTSWNAGLVYSPIESINFRVMRSRSVRAPNVDELYSTESQGFTNVSDPCSAANLVLNPNRATNCAALGIPANFVATTSSKAAYFGGNPNLNVETSNTWTAGITVAPHFIPHLSFTADWFQVDLSKAIGSIDPQTLLNSCVDLPASVSSNPACGTITRDPTNHQVTGIYSNNQNIGRLLTRGIDLTLGYNMPFQKIPGVLDINATATDLIDLRQFTNSADPSTQTQYEGFLGLPKWQVLGTVTYSLQQWAVTWRTRYIGSTSVEFNQLVQQPLPSNLHDTPQTGSKVYNDFSLLYTMGRTSSVRFNVDNIFNVIPPVRGYDVNEGISYGSNYGTASIYPNLGTTFSLVLQHKFW